MKAASLEGGRDILPLPVFAAHTHHRHAAGCARGGSGAPYKPAALAEVWVRVNSKWLLVVQQQDARR